MRFKRFYNIDIDCCFVTFGLNFIGLIKVIIDKITKQNGDLNSFQKAYT